MQMSNSKSLKNVKIPALKTKLESNKDVLQDIFYKGIHPYAIFRLLNPMQNSEELWSCVITKLQDNIVIYK
jgi:hypothetical protein